MCYDDTRRRASAPVVALLDCCQHSLVFLSFCVYPLVYDPLLSRLFELKLSRFIERSDDLSVNLV